jgi:hypothetical protein
MKILNRFGAGLASILGAVFATPCDPRHVYMRDVQHKPAPPARPITLADLKPIAVLLPGDSLILSFARSLTMEQRDQVRASLVPMLPPSIKVAIVHGASVAIARGGEA